jgi:phosphonate transport system substrate-binding protein
MSNTMPTAGHPKFSLPRVLATLVPLMLLIGGGMWYWKNQIDTRTKETIEQTTYAKLGIDKPQKKTLDKKFTDADGDLVADAPKDPAQFVEPARLVFSYVGAEDSERQKEVWKEFIAALATATEKPVDFLIINTPDEQLEALKSGKLHLTAVNTGNVPAAVRECGFVPDVTLAESSGKIGHTMKLLVPSDSKITKPEELRGQRIAFVNRRSNSGFKAPIVLLMKDYNLKPLRDFEWLFTYSHDDSIAGIANKTYPAAPVASDMLARAEARGEIKPEQYRVISESELFPPVALGHVYNLKPELVAKINAVYKDFNWSGTGLEKEFGPSGIVKFVPADYKQQWFMIRLIDDAMGPDPAKIESPALPEEVEAKVIE